MHGEWRGQAVHHPPSAGRALSPGLAVILAGHNPASEIYVRNKVRTSEELGIYSEKLTPPDSVTPSDPVTPVDAVAVSLPKRSCNVG